MTTTKDPDRTTLYLRGVPTRLVREAKALAARRGITLTALVGEALSAVTASPPAPSGDLPEELQQDAAWYEQHKPELLERYGGEYLAVVDRQVIDHDAQFGALASRVFSSLGSRPVFMPICAEEEPVLELRSPKVRQ